jgi:hypothetical protein
MIINEFSRPTNQLSDWVGGKNKQFFCYSVQLHSNGL